MTENKRNRKEVFLNKHVFQGLTNLNDGFDAGAIKYFSQEEFEIVLERVHALGLYVGGIEAFKDKQFYKVEVGDAYDGTTGRDWYFESLKKMKSEGIPLLYSASYYTHKEMFGG